VNAQRPMRCTRLLPVIFGSILLLVGMMLAFAGARLASMGASFHYMMSGIGLLSIGVLLLMARRCAVNLFALLLLLSTLWALWEIGVDGEELLPRLAIWFVVGAVLLLPRMRTGLRPTGQDLSTAWLIIALVLAMVSVEPQRQVDSVKAWASRLIPSLQPDIREQVAEN
jgi:glucose dehydrogenase